MKNSVVVMVVKDLENINHINDLENPKNQNDLEEYKYILLLFKICNFPLLHILLYYDIMYSVTGHPTPDTRHPLTANMECILALPLSNRTIYDNCPINRNQEMSDETRNE